MNRKKQNKLGNMWEKNKKVVLLLVFLFLVFLIPSLRRFFGIPFLIALGILSMVYIQFIPYCGLEFIFFPVVIVSIAYNPLLGVFVGFVAYIVGMGMAGQLTAYSIVTLAGQVMVAYMAPLMYFHWGMPIVILGVVLKIMNLIVMSIGWILLGFNPFEAMITNVVNILLNYIFFSLFGALFLNLLMVV
ncbi:MAG: hypothetical protein KKF44_01620 [Nanoarchaeota archaeon]|nr:hypothetical protein [Nanoarchaeota archaeon]